MISGALVQLINDLGEEWEYKESAGQGIYLLHEEDFKALARIKYKLRVGLAEDDVYESDWQELPARPYYRWKFMPTWIYIAPLANITGSNNRRVCWATNPFYIRNYTRTIGSGWRIYKGFFLYGYRQNERVLEEFSLLVEQHTMTEDNFYFWKEMQDLNQSGSIFDTPPYNLKTNFHSLNGEKMVSGYFGVMGEQSKRWYFNIKDLSYNYENTLFADCSVPCGPGCPPLAVLTASGMRVANIRM